MAKNLNQQNLNSNKISITKVTDTRLKHAGQTQNFSRLYEQQVRNNMCAWGDL